MATVSEVRAALAQAARLETEAHLAVQNVSGQLAEALQLLNRIRESSIDPMGAPQVTEAIERCDRVGALCQRAIEAALTYMETL